MKIVLTITLFLHGLIHFMGFAKAFGYGNLTQFSKEISRPMGFLWMLAGILFVVSALLYFLKKDAWPVLAIVAVVVSQILIFTLWKDAKFGTIANMVILVAAIIGFASYQFESEYREDVTSAIKKFTVESETVTGRDLEHLPTPVKKYLMYVGIVGKPKVGNVRIVFEGEMRDKGKDWFTFTSQQYNFFESPVRLFFMKAKVSGLPTNGYHRYDREGASMLVKVLSLIPAVDLKSKEMYPTETVTFFNDLCLFAPAALIDKRIQWQAIDGLSANATFTTAETTISATLYFNEAGQLINFVSNDRYSIAEMKTFPFSTPASNYKLINGYHLPTYGEAVWHYPDGEFVYGKFNVISVAYNVTDLW
ncbi:hypothetical protein RQM65_15435 [Pricia sp. S334]|uniref:Uncharacterized protein n=1 Tax=Pricia mediterranea TaxID=3076079 RepID=A0ABU3L8J7_9FLAO|nr:DUF6544 family protein [Pricia sp. S334]MDT7830060.1 hypothetical protein [Pricia sp. S334]